MTSHAPSFTESGSQSTKSEHKSLGEIHVWSDDRLSKPGPSLERHELDGEPGTTFGQPNPVSIIEATSNWQDKRSNKSANTQRKTMAKDCLSQDLEKGIEPTHPWKPSIAIIDVNNHGARTRPWRGWVDGPEAERPVSGTASPSIRITLVERKLIKRALDEEHSRYEGYPEDENVERKFCMQHLQALLRTEKTNPSFILQTNILPSASDRKIGTPLLPDFQVLGFGYLLWELYTKVTFNFSEDFKVEIICEFPTMHSMIPLTRWAEPILDKLSPPQEAFETLLHSTRSALEFSTGDVTLTCQLIALDLMRSALEGWEIFLRNLIILLPKAKRYSRPRRFISLEELERDVETSNNINSMIRDFAACITFSIAAVEARLEPTLAQKDDNRAQRWKLLTTEITFLSGAVQDMAKDLTDTSDRVLASFVAQFSQQQAISAKRLTIVASVFLPLTLSASLMAMTTHVNAIGDLWYDWAGLCFVTGTIVFVVYSNCKIMEKLIFKHKDWIQWWLASTVIRAFPIIWWATGFLAIITSSFVAGMVYTKESAVEILKYGIPAFISIAILWLISKMFFDVAWPLYRIVRRV